MSMNAIEVVVLTKHFTEGIDCWPMIGEETRICEIYMHDQTEI